MAKTEDNSKTIQEVSQKEIKGDVLAENFHIDKVETLIINHIYGKQTEKLETKQFEQEDIKRWAQDDLIISISDSHMIKKIIENEKELTAILPEISKRKRIFNLLPKNHKGLFVLAYQTVLKEDEVSARLKDPKLIDTKLLYLMDELVEEEARLIYSSDYFSDYKKIYNLIRCGDLENFVLPHVEKLEIRYKDNPESIHENFLNYWYKRLENHPYAIFFSSAFPSKRLEIEIISKLTSKQDCSVKVFVRGNRIVIARFICTKIATDNGLKLEEKNYQIGFNDAAMFTFN